jgi:2-iminobutanoate/2-iminopropanoate deaminase
MTRNVIATDGAPAAIGPYSQGVVAGGFLFTAMQIALDPRSGELVGADAPAQIAQCLRNVAGIVTAAGARLDDVVKVTVYLTDLAAFVPVNEVYGTFFTAAPPARAVVGVSALPRGALVAVEAVVAVSR